MRVGARVAIGRDSNNSIPFSRERHRHLHRELRVEIGEGLERVGKGKPIHGLSEAGLVDGYGTLSPGG